MSLLKQLIIITIFCQVASGLVPISEKKSLTLEGVRKSSRQRKLMQKSTTAPESAIAVVDDGEVSGDIDVANSPEMRGVRNLAQVGYLAAAGIAFLSDV